MPLNKNLRGFLRSFIKPSINKKQLDHAILAIKILERGYITEYELRTLKFSGYNEMKGNYREKNVMIEFLDIKTKKDNVIRTISLSYSNKTHKITLLGELQHGTELLVDQNTINQLQKFINKKDKK